MNPKLSALLIAILVCTIIWFAGWAIFNVLQLETSITSATYQQILMFLEVVFTSFYAYIQYRAFRKPSSQPPKPIQEAVKNLKVAGEKLSKISLLTESQPQALTLPEFEREETIISTPELPLQLDDEEDSSTKNVKLSDMRRQVVLKRLELQAAVYGKLIEDVKAGNITIKTAEDILASDGSKVPATLESSSTKKTEELKKETSPPPQKIRESKL